MSLLKNFYAPSQEPNTARFGLIQVCDPKTQSAYQNDLYATLEIRVIRESHDVDHGGEGGYRWANWSSSKPTASYLDNLVIRASFDKDKRAGGNDHLHGFKTSFDIIGTNPNLDAQDVETLHKTLRRIARVAHVHRQSGHIVDFLVYARDVLKAVGLSRDALVGYTDNLILQRANLDTKYNFQELPHTKAMMDHGKLLMETVWQGS